MKMTKKIMILFVMIIGILVLGMTKVNATNYLPREDNNKKVDSSELKEDKYFIRYAQDYLKLNNLFCAEKGLRLWSTRYKL